MSIESLLQLGFAGFIASYLVIFLVRDVKQSQKAILDVLECILEAFDIKRSR